MRCTSGCSRQRCPATPAAIRSTTSTATRKQLLTDCIVEPALADGALGDVVQFERLGYFAHDPRTPMLFHRTVGLRDEWANIQKRS